MKNDLDTILKITSDAQEIPRRYFRHPLQVEDKADQSPVTVADRATEQFIRDGLSKHFPDHGVLGEEFGENPGHHEFLWVIDPIDGTRSFISGMPLYGMLVALLHKNRPILGVVRMPELQEVYHGTESGAFLNGEQKLATSNVTRISDAFIYINEAAKILAQQPDVIDRINGASKDQRFSFDCYPHMLVASGHVDGCIDFDLQPYDFLALVPIIQAAGGVITDWQGGELGRNSDGRIVSAATPELHRELLALLEPK